MSHQHQLLDVVKQSYQTRDCKIPTDNNYVNKYHFDENKGKIADCLYN